jgi:hypothetical protein
MGDTLRSTSPQGRSCDRTFPILDATAGNRCAWRVAATQDGRPENAQSNIRGIGWPAAAVAILTSILTPLSALGEEDWRNLYRDAKPLLDVRYRYEHVDQDGFDKNANANTIRTRAGIETGRFYGIGGVAEFQATQSIGRQRYNSTVNNNTQYPVVADPNNLDLDQLYVDLDGTVPHTGLKAGRQRVLWDNQRFIGNVGFRQNEQTFDSVRATTTVVPDSELEYLYMWRVHQVFGRKSDVGSLPLQGHGFHLHYSGLDALQVSPFGLLLDYQDRSQRSLSSATGGALLEGNYALSSDWTIYYPAGFANQQDFGNNPNDFNLWYYALQPGISYDLVKGAVGYEVLEGDGENAFQTPLATLHKFNGLTDQFLTTPPDGLQDLYFTLDVDLPSTGLFSDIAFQGSYHEYWAEHGNAHYGSEWDIGVFKAFQVDNADFVLGVQYGDYDADKFSTDTKKLWVSLDFKLGPKPFRDLFDRAAPDGSR